MNPVTNQEDDLIIFTDLDGTLLDPIDYSYAVAKPAVARLQEQGIPIIFCSSKTRAEQEIFRTKLGIGDPFIVEDGGAIYIEQGYFPFPYKYDKSVGGFQVIELGMPYEEIRSKIREINEKNGLKIRGFGDMSAEDIAAMTGLDVESAGLAKKREYEETLDLENESPEAGGILKKIEEAGLKWSRGSRFYSVSAGSDKGKAVRIIINLFQRKLGRVKTAGIGDSPNDTAMLTAVDMPFLVQKPGGGWVEMKIKNLNRVNGVGPQGWILAVKKFEWAVEDLNH
jgi:mannosyl-3-phosphoglycerate phosphatase